jgi:hypothetical protein
LEPSALRNAREHRGPDLFVIMKCEDEVRPSLSGECPMRTRLSFNPPTDSQRRGEHAPGLGGRPMAHAAWNVTLSNSPGAS